MSDVVGGWRELFGPEHRAPVVVLAGGIGLFATNTYVTTSLLPSAVTQIGGGEFYAWTMTVFVVASVASSMLVSRALDRFGSRLSYLGGFGVFALGTLLAAVAPSMPVLLTGRAVQGLAAGLLAGLAFAVVRLVLPASLWQRAVALLSAMWGVGNLAGPVVGGFFAQIGFWRGAFLLLAAIAVGLAAVAARVLPVRSGTGGDADPVPWTALVLLAAAALALSVASIVSSSTATGLWVLGAVAATVAFVWRERGAAHRVLPRLVYHGASPLRWIYLAIGLLTLASTIETFVPLFGQRLGGMSPLVAGLLGAAISWGWTVASLISSTVTSDRVRRRVQVAGPVLISLGFVGYAALQVDGPSGAVVTGWFVALFVAGCGIGMAMAHWLTAGLRVSDDPHEAAHVSAGMNTTQLIATAFGSAMAGLLVAVGGPEILGSARVLSVGYALVGVVAVAAVFGEFAADRRHRAQHAR
ncbi:MFS transporter [Gordonia alkaliphila]|uniref:MFS transporter n=1 Tax=Gordonia alkaliphila TaxID=1053547 RepID=A0ABP8Z7E2_9ACTN|nr:MFS transporter [Gordonia alkaliphila]MCK0440032.1 MFS transporter [Gordonia alkaliphila]